MAIKQEEAKIYDAWLYWFLPGNCNLACSYCKSVKYRSSISDLPRINIPSLIRVLEKTDKIFQISLLSVGETFMVPDLIEVCQAITEKHYVSVITNLTSPRIKEFTEKIDPRRVINICASAHVKELERKNLLNVYFDNFRLLKNKGFNVTAMEVAYPAYLSEVEKHKKLFFRQGINLDFGSFVGSYHGKKYPNAYTKKEIETFKIFPETHSHYQKPCSAGNNFGVILPNGEVKSCLKGENIGHIYTGINFKKDLIICPFKFCECTFNLENEYLLKKALKEVDLKIFKRIFFSFKHYLSRINRYNSVRLIGQVGIFLKQNSPKLYFFLKKLKGI